MPTTKEGFKSLQSIVGQYKPGATFPKIAFPEIQKAFFYVFENGTAEMQFFFNVETERSQSAAIPPIEVDETKGFWVEIEATKEQVLDCVAFANLFDVDANGKIEHDNGKTELTEDWVRDAIKADSRIMTIAFILLFGCEGIEQARGDWEAAQHSAQVFSVPKIAKAA